MKNPAQIVVEIRNGFLRYGGRNMFQFVTERKEWNMLGSEKGEKGKVLLLAYKIPDGFRLATDEDKKKKKPQKYAMLGNNSRGIEERTTGDIYNEWNGGVSYFVPEDFGKVDEKKQALLDKADELIEKANEMKEEAKKL